ncbi:thioredoxin family protein [Thalassotalea montiporae]
MKYVIATLLMVSILGFSGAVAAQEKSDLPLYSKVYDDKRDPFKDAVAAINLAKASNRNVLIEIGGNWCTWCHKMDAFLEKNPDIYNKLHQEFVILKVNVSDSNENEAFMKGLPPVLGYPHMYVSTAAGKMVLSKDTAELQEDGKYSRENWLSFIEQWKPKTEQIEPKA